NNARLRRRLLEVLRVVEYGSRLPRGGRCPTLIECKRRPRGRRCSGLLTVERADSEGGATLVRSGGYRQEGAQDQALSPMNPMTTPKRVKLKASPKGRPSRPRFAICID